ncbi:ABC transporter permease [Mesorhizobium sp. B3-1-3]|nr:ABC transporter permease [Mesorhizobium sp. B3-1-8]TPI63360.1 ABC transporter permease [Mesorhizobium sp. B3-1-3]
MYGTAMFLFLPTLVALPISFSESAIVRFPPEGFTLHWYLNVWEDSRWSAATLTSLYVGAITMLLSVTLGTLASLGLHNWRGKLPSFLKGFLLAPLVSPLIVLAVGMYLMFARWGIVGSSLALVIAHTTLGIPFVIVAVTASLRTLNENLILAAWGLGTGPTRTFFAVTLPLIWPGVLSGAIFAFIASWDEVVLAYFVSNAETRTLPVLIWSQVRTELNPSTAAVASMLIMVSAAVVLAVTRKQRIAASDRSSNGGLF